MRDLLASFTAAALLTTLAGCDGDAPSATEDGGVEDGGVDAAACVIECAPGVQLGEFLHQAERGFLGVRRPHQHRRNKQMAHGPQPFKGTVQAGVRQGERKAGGILGSGSRQVVEQGALVRIGGGHAVEIRLELLQQ